MLVLHVNQQKYLWNTKQKL